jgi:hypothetical protein
MGSLRTTVCDGKRQKGGAEHETVVGVRKGLRMEARPINGWSRATVDWLGARAEATVRCAGMHVASVRCRPSVTRNAEFFAGSFAENESSPTQSLLACVRWVGRTACA